MIENLAENLWVFRFPLSLIGIQEGRIVTIFRLSSGDLVIHSTAPFSPQDLETIASLGRPAWLIDATLFHDTYAEAGRAAFPALPYLAPERFPVKSGPVRPLTDPPAEWSPELELLPLDGMPRVREHLFFHRPSRTLVVADLVFNFDQNAPRWTRAFFRYAAGVRHSPGVSRLFRACIRDRYAFTESIRQMMRWDFDRLIVGHGAIIESGAKTRLASALAAHGFCPPAVSS